MHVWCECIEVYYVTVSAVLTHGIFAAEADTMTQYTRTVLNTLVEVFIFKDIAEFRRMSVAKISSLILCVSFKMNTE